ncbi:hypothetical protein AB0884_37070, partial [Streptomyces sp. NPDC005283]
LTELRVELPPLARHDPQLPLQSRSLRYEGKVSRRVPYITAGTAESVPQPKVIRLLGRGDEGIGYADEESLIDRQHEALWIRTDHAQGRVRPDFARVNSLRQKRAMRFSPCQVCGEAALPGPPGGPST